MGLVTNMNSSSIKYSHSNSSTKNLKSINVSNSAKISYNTQNNFNKVKPELMNLVGATDKDKVNNIADVVKIAQENKNKKVFVPEYEEPEEVSFGDCVVETCAGYWNGFKSVFKKGKKKASDALDKADKVFEKLNATIAGTCTSLVEGAGKFGEAVVDCAALSGTGLISLVSCPIDLIAGTDFTDYMYGQTYDFIAKDHVGNTFDKFYEDTKVGQWISNNSYGFDKVRCFSSNIGYVGGVILTSYFTGGASALAMAEVATVSGIGKGAETAYSNGAEGAEGAEAALATGLWEGFQFYVGGKINKLSPFSSTSQNVALRIGLDTIDGGAEGFVQPAISSIYQKGYYDEETGEYIEFTDEDSFADRYGKIWDEQGGLKQVGTQAAVAALMSGTGEGVGYLGRNAKFIKNADNISKKLDKIPFEQLDEADKQFIKDARKDLNMSEFYTNKDVLNEIDRINKNLDFDKIDTKNMGLKSMKKISDAIDGLDPKVQKDIIEGLTGNKSLKNIKNKGQFDYTMEKYLKSLNMDDVAKMDASTKNILNEYMQDKLTKDGYAVSGSSAEDMFDTYTKIKAYEESMNAKNIDGIDVTEKLVKTQPSIKNIDKTQPLDVTQPSIKNLDKTQPSIKNIDKTQPLNVTQPLNITQPLNVNKPKFEGTDVTQPLDINKINKQASNTNKSLLEMDVHELHDSITKEINSLDPNDPNYYNNLNLLKQKEQLEMKLKNQLDSYGNNTAKEIKAIDSLPPNEKNLVEQYAQDVHKKALYAEKNVTDSMLYLEDSNTQLVGLNYKVKSLDSIQEKIARMHQNYGYNIQDASLDINDSLRYTLLVDSNNYESVVLYKLSTLRKQGYNIKYVNNAWNNPVYKGLNVTLTSPDGVMVELQFHTEGSYRVKQILNHDFYEISRNTSMDNNTKKIATEIQKINQEVYGDKIKFDYDQQKLKTTVDNIAFGKVKNINLTPIKQGENVFEYAKNRNLKAKMYSTYDEYAKSTAKEAKKWKKILMKEDYIEPNTGNIYSLDDIVSGYVSETVTRPGNYAFINTVNRAMGNTPQETLNNLLLKNYDGTPIVDLNGKYTIRIYKCIGFYEDFKYNPVTNVVEKIGVDGKNLTFDQMLVRAQSETNALNKALSLGNKSKPMILGRGAKWNSLEKYGITKYDDAAIIYQKMTANGDVYVDNGFMSSTPELGGGFMGGDVNYIITTKENALVGNFSEYNSLEKEVLIGSGSKFEISGVRKDDNGAIYIYLEQI